MKLRTQVLLAMVLMLLVPLGAIAVLISARNGGTVPGQALFRYIFLTNWVKQNISEGPDGRPVIRQSAESLDKSSVLVFDRFGHLADRTDGQADEPWGSTALRTSEQVLSDGRRFYWQTLHSGGKVYGSVVVLVSSNRPPAEEALSPFDWVSLYLILLLITAGILGLWLGRLTRQVHRLQGATNDLIQRSWDQPVSLDQVSTKEFRVLGLAMESLRSALIDEQEKRARFLAAVSHDLKTPLTSILGYVEAIEDGLASDPVTLQKYLQVIRSKGTLLDGRLSDLIDYGRMNSEDWSPRLESADLVKFIRDLAFSLEEDARLLGLAMEVVVPGPMEPIHFDPHLLTRAIENLMTNAFQFAPTGSVVRLTLNVESEILRLCVEDEGPGLAPEEMPFVFEPFFRGGFSRRGGHGLGLYIARTIVLGHGWSITAEPKSGCGARFVIGIPTVRRIG